MYQSLIEMIKQPIFWSIITFVIVLASFLAMITDLFKRKSPIEVGFLFNGSINSNLRISTGDPAKKVYFRFKNTSKIALTNIFIDIRLLKPLALSGTKSAIESIEGSTTHGRSADKSFYHILHSNLDFFGQKEIDLGIELNTKGKPVGRSEVLVEVNTTNQNYKPKKSKLYLHLQ